jgi:carboxylesterase
VSSGVLLLHGFGGSPASMEPWAEYLAARGHQTAVPRLPGHGTRWEDMADKRWTDWYATASSALDDLRGRSDTVAVAGLSMGAALALRLAAERPADVASLVLVNPVLKHVIGSVGNSGTMVKKPGVPRVSYERLPLRAVSSLRDLWADVRPRLGEVRQPLLLFRSVTDGELSSRIVMAGAGSPEKHEVLLHDSYHLATIDNDAPRIFAESAEWLEARAALPAG